MDIVEITRTIFSKPPKDSNSIQLDFSDADHNLSSKELFEVLLMMFTEGMKTLFGDNNGKVNLGNVTHNDFNKINEYFHSFGFNVDYNIRQLNAVEQADYTEKKELKDHYMRLRSNNMMYIISFDFYIANTTCK